MRQSVIVSVLFLLVAACGGNAAQPPPVTPGSEPGNPSPSGAKSCDDADLPPCPAACSGPSGDLAGKPCTTDGERCGNDLGDGCQCTGGSWQCTVHGPLKPEGCNKVCR